MTKKLKYIRPEIEVLDIEFEICDAMQSTVSGGGGDVETGSGFGEGPDRDAKQEDFIFDTSEDFDSPYYLFE